MKGESRLWKLYHQYFSFILSYAKWYRNTNCKVWSMDLSEVPFKITKMFIQFLYGKFSNNFDISYQTKDSYSHGLHLNSTDYETNKIIMNDIMKQIRYDHIVDFCFCRKNEN